ncbi:MAG: replication initiator protein A [Gammaproteobacteria bacterium]
MVDPLLPDRHPDRDFFICDFGDVIPKSDIASMEHPLFTLSTKPDTTIRCYEHNGSSVTITPSVLGLATIKDKDVLIYAISQLLAGINQGDIPNRKVRFKAHDLLITTNRGTGGTEYKLLKMALDRLAGTLITTNIKTNDKQITEGFGIIDGYRIVVEDERNKRMLELEITLSEWLFNAVLGQEVLSINRNYFRLRKPIERRIYEIARKHCGTQNKWSIGIKKLHKKVGSSGVLKQFKFTLKHLIEHNHLPDYRISLEGDIVNFSFESDDNSLVYDGDYPRLKPDTIEKARQILGRNFEVYSIEAEWIDYWKSSKYPDLSSPDGAFIGFCKKKVGQQ